MKTVGMIIAVGIGCLTAFAEDLELTSDRTINVESGQTVSYGALTGGAYTLTKTGEGTLEFSAIANSQAAIEVEAGKLRIAGLETAPAVFGSAILFLDAGRLDTLAVTETGKPPSPDYDGRIRSWFDANGRDLKAASSTGYGTPVFRPADETVCGLPLIDFLTMYQSAYDTLCKNKVSLDMQVKSTSESALVEGVRDLMIVAMDTEDVKTTMTLFGLKEGSTVSRATPFVGVRNAETIYFLRGERNAPGENSAVANGVNDNTKRVSQGEIRFDGVLQSATAGYPDGLHLLEYRPTDEVSFAALARDRSQWAGGVRFGSLVAFSSVLSDADRQSVRNYLLTRWVPAPLRKLTLKDGACLEFSHAAGLHPAVLSYSGQSVVSGGTLVCDSEEAATGSISPAEGVWRYGIGASGLLPSCAQAGGVVKYGAGWYARPEFKPSVVPFYHVDASLVTSMYTNTVNGTNFIESWHDADGGTVRSTKSSGLQYPFLRDAFLNGRPVVDFGSYCILAGGKAGGAPTVGGWGGALSWNETCSNVREVITVASDTEDLIDNWANIKATVTGYDLQYKRAQPFVCSASANPHFLRGNRDGSGTDSAPMLLSTALAYSTAKITVDGQDVSNDSNYPAGFHVVNILSKQDGLYASAFSTDRLQTGGGTRIAEYYVFTEELSDDERARLLEKMNVKWFGREPTRDVESYAGLSVGAAASYRAGYAKVAVSGAFDLAGDMDVAYLSLSGTVNIAPDAKLSGTVALQDGSCLNLTLSGPSATDPVRSFDKVVLSGGTVTLNLDAPNASGYGGMSVPLISAGAVEGAAMFVVSGEKFARKPVNFVWRNGTLYADFEKSGIVIVVR